VSPEAAGVSPEAAGVSPEAAGVSPEAAGVSAAGESAAIKLPGSTCGQQTDAAWSLAGSNVAGTRSEPTVCGRLSTFLLPSTGFRGLSLRVGLASTHTCIKTYSVGVNFFRFQNLLTSFTLLSLG
jgi:hypothetical protein